jgi:Type II secretory pathway, component PulD
VAEVLRIIASGQDNPDLSPSPANRAISDTSSSFQNSGSGSSGGGGGGFGGGGNKSTPPSSAKGSSGSSQANADKNAAKVLIQAEPTNNALIIQAPEAVYRNLRMVINMLDVRRVQVMIEALIADVNTTEQGNFGIQWIGGAGNNNAGAAVLSNYGGNGSSVSSIATTALSLAGGASGTGSPAAPASLPGEIYVGLVTGTVNIGGQTIPGISALADMLAATSSGNIIGRPTLLNSLIMK